MKKYLLSLIVTLLAVPTFSFAQVPNQTLPPATLQIIAQLMERVKVLQAQLDELLVKEQKEQTKLKEKKERETRRSVIAAKEAKIKLAKDKERLKNIKKELLIIETRLNVNNNNTNCESRSEKIFSNNGRDEYTQRTVYTSYAGKEFTDSTEIKNRYYGDSSETKSQSELCSEANLKYLTDLRLEKASLEEELQ